MLSRPYDILNDSCFIRASSKGTGSGVIAVVRGVCGGGVGGMYSNTP